MKKIINFLILLLVFSVGSVSTYFIVKKYSNNTSKIIKQTNNNIKIDDTGISSAVENVYDAVVTVTTYKNDRLYASGTGFVFKADNENAYLLTNAHVIRNADEVSVTFTSGKTEKADVVGKHSISDIAVLSIKYTDEMRLVKIGKSDDVKVGDTVFTVGAPLDDAFSWTVTRGILSGKNRLVEVSDQDDSRNSYLMNVLQTDAAINSGNSGGPLSNSKGEVIGITSLKLVQDGVEGIGFAIPIETAIKYAAKIINNEEIETSYFGAALLNASEAYYYPSYNKYVKDYDKDYGVLIAEIDEKSPAAKAGLKDGDIVVKIGDDKCKSVSYFKYVLFNHEPGEEIKVTYYRDAKEHTANVKLTKANS